MLLHVRQMDRPEEQKEELKRLNSAGGEQIGL